MLIDDITIIVRAGNGGNGIVSFNKGKMSLGPTGGSGGGGGSVWLEGVSKLDALNQFRFKKELKAGDGGQGKIRLNDGATAKDLILKVPVGTVIHDLTHNTVREVVRIGDRIATAKGGRGGKGNFLFRSSKNTSPKEFEYGAPGDQAMLRLELKLIADVGFIGLPNAGKSSLLNELTNAKSKVANYPFTTLEPYLGVCGDLILADIPGLIKEASTGKGLGVKFLRHIERTRVLFHFISAESEDLEADWRVIRDELGKYKETLLEKREYLFLSKSDVVSVQALKEKLALVKKLNPSAMAISIHDPECIAAVEQLLHRLTGEKHLSEVFHKDPQAGHARS